MIQCERCKTVNESDSKTCAHCGANLLPGRTIVERLISFGLGVLALVLMGVITDAIPQPLLRPGGQPTPNPLGLPPPRTTCICLVSLAFLSLAGSLLWFAMGPERLHEKYASRAERHKTLDAERALLDYGEAIRLAPAKGSYRYKRGLLYEKLGRSDEARIDFQEALDLDRKKADHDVKRKQIEEALLRISTSDTSGPQHEAS